MKSQVGFGYLTQATNGNISFRFCPSIKYTGALKTLLRRRQSWKIHSTRWVMTERFGIPYQMRYSMIASVIPIGKTVLQKCKSLLQMCKRAIANLRHQYHTYIQQII